VTAYECTPFDRNFTYLLVMLKPFGCNLWDGIILMSLARRDSGELQWVTLFHGSEEFLIDVFLKSCGLLYITKVVNTQIQGKLTVRVSLRF
jgi:hypothetical protein